MVNDFEPTPPDWYRPGKPLRTLFWYLRNPFHNAGRYVIGVADRTYTVTGRWPVMATVVRGCAVVFPHRDLRGRARRSSSRMAGPCRGSHTRHRAGWLIGGWQRNRFAGVKFNRMAYLFSPLLPLAFVVLVLVRT